jgi:hypothetical protein
VGSLTSMRQLAIAAGVVALAGGGAAYAASSPPKGDFLSVGRAASLTRHTFPIFAPELLLKDERSRVFVARRGVDTVSGCDRVSRSIVDCKFTIRLSGTDPEPGETADKTKTGCSGILRVRRSHHHLSARLRDYTCKAL